MNTFRYNFVKGLLVVLVTTILLPCGSAKAQTIQSAQYKLTTCPGANVVVVRESATGTPVISFRKHESTYTSVGAHFLYGNLYANTAKEFFIPDTLLVLNNQIRYIVNDMRVVGDMCYFCGVREYVHGEVDPWTGLMVIDSVGILGRFRLDPSGFGSSVNYDLKQFAEIKSLDRMATYVYQLDTIIAMIGVADTTPFLSCLTVARERNAGVWEYNVEYPPLTADRDVFTDIAIDTGKTTIASYQMTNEGKDHFCLRFSENFMLQFDYYIQFDDLYRYDLNQFNFCNAYVRPSHADVRLSAVPWSKKVYAAFECSKSDCEPYLYQTAMCEISTDSKVLKAIQLIQRFYGKPYTLADMKYLYKKYLDEADASVALLHRAGDSYNTVVEYPLALTSSYSGTVPKVLAQLLKDEELHSVSAYKGNDVRFGGKINSSPASVLTYLQEILPAKYDNSQCMKNGDADIVYKDSPKEPTPTVSALTRRYPNMKALDWTAKPSATTSVTAEQTCMY